ncbi:hypothetical protein N7540_013261 [Penicillium herquei]|nr:hypothetical protein N7540_013261 [Penicillium herquei]
MKSADILEIATACSGPLGSEIRDFLDNSRDRTSPALKLLHCYLDMWEFYVIRSAEMVRLKDEHRRLQELNDCLVGEAERGTAGSKTSCARLQNGVISALHASDPQPFPIFGPEQDPEMVHTSDGSPVQDVQT